MASNTLDLAAEIHASLLKLVGPATPDSIRASSLKWKDNPTLSGITWLAVLALVGVVVGNGLAACPQDSATATATTGCVAPWSADPLRIIGGAVLGSAFYSLYTAGTYIKSSTFDRKYVSTYQVRFGIGILAGAILAYVLRDTFKTDADSAITKLGPSALALIGGYAAEVVVKILDRMSETLLTLVGGGEKDKIDAAKQKAEAEAEKKTTLALAETAKKLQQALNDKSTPGKLEEGVQKAMQEILDRK